MRRIARREFIALSAVGLAGKFQGGGRVAARSRERSKRRLLFNWDGSMIHCWGRAALGSQGPLTREQFTSLVFTPIENTAVDTLLFSFGSGNVAEYQSGVLEWPGEADNFKFPETKRWHGGVEVDPRDQYLNPKSLADGGHNPPAVIVEECRKRGLDVFVSLRMNDIHDGQHSQGTLPNPELPTFKRHNPEWLVNFETGDFDGLDWWSALNYSLPQVRALKLRVIEEFFDRWDFDGIELDWLRHTLFFPRGTERDNAKYLTDFMRSVRHSLNERARRRGRPIEVAIRIPERVAWCLEGGFEVPTWIEEGLVDLLILGQGLTELPTLSEFRTLMTTRQIPIYPCLNAYGSGYRISPEEVIRGSAANLWRNGADGIYTFNWSFLGRWRKHLLDEISSSDLLAKKNKHYALVHRFEMLTYQPGPDPIRYNTALKTAPVPMDLRVVDGRKTLSIPIADDLASKSSPPVRAELWIGVDFLGPGDQLEIWLNDERLGPSEIELAESLELAGYRVAVPPGEGMLGLKLEGDLNMTFQALRLEVPVRVLRQGSNKLSLRLKKRNKEAEKPLRVRRVELATQFQGQPAAMVAAKTR